MSDNDHPFDADPPISRRTLLKLGGAAFLSGPMLGSAPVPPAPMAGAEGPLKIKKYRPLGRTGFQVSDIVIGGGGVGPNFLEMLRRGVERGMNFLDTAHIYGNGESERIIGKLLREVDRKRLFVTTKVRVRNKYTESALADQVHTSLERLGVDHVDALFMHGVAEAKVLGHPGFHDLVKRLKAEGRVRFVGVSSHGPPSEVDDSLKKVVCAAAEDGRFDLVMFPFNFMLAEESEAILASCKKKNVGAIAMKTMPLVLFRDEAKAGEGPPFVFESPDRVKGLGLSVEEATERVGEFMAKTKSRNLDQLMISSLKWVLQRNAVHTACVTLDDADVVDAVVPLSGTTLSRADHTFLERYEAASARSYCRHGCSACLAACPSRLPVGTIMRYAYYFKRHGREAFAAERYGRLEGRDAALCSGCDAPCARACPYRLDVRSHLLRAHALLRSAA